MSREKEEIGKNVFSEILKGQFLSFGLREKEEKEGREGKERGKEKREEKERERESDRRLLHSPHWGKNVRMRRERE